MSQEFLDVGEPLFGQPREEQSMSPVSGEADAIAKTRIGRVPDTRGDGVLQLEAALGKSGVDIVGRIRAARRIVFHATGDTGNSESTLAEKRVVDKLISDFDEPDPLDRPSFLFHLGDVVYSFGETRHYYDEFYKPFQRYPAPIFAIPGNHDGATYTGQAEESLEAFLRNFCSEHFNLTPEANTIARTTQIQPGVYFTLAAPFVRIIGLYSNRLGDPGVISDENGTYTNLNRKQMEFLADQLTISKEFTGATLLAVHHPPFTFGTNHQSSLRMLADIDECCGKAKFWPHAVLSGHSHNYERFTRIIPETQSGEAHDMGQPFIVCGLGGHELTKVRSDAGNRALRVPVNIRERLNSPVDVVFENYFDRDYGHLRIVVSETTLRIEFHDAGAGDASKSAADAVTVELKTHRIVPS